MFDWAWARAYHEHGVPYYPKLLVGIPYSPVTGPRLLIRRNHPQAGELREMLARSLMDHAQRNGFSGIHCNFIPEPQHHAFADQAWLPRYDWQFHWHNRSSPYEDFDDFLGELKSRKRKKIRQERRTVREAGISTEILRGSEIDDDTLAFAHQCYQRTFTDKGNLPVLSLAFFRHLRDHLGDGLVLTLGRTDSRPVACAVMLAGGDRLYGRYWGRAEDVGEQDTPGLHFELCYYLGIELCIQQGWKVFEPGAQGEHKIARGFVPVQTHSFHHLCHPAFQDAIRRHLEQERRWVAEYGTELQSRNPYRRSS